MKKQYYPWIIIAIIAIVVLGGIYFYSSKKVNITISEPNAAGMKTYTDNDYKFTIQFPNDFILERTDLEQGRYTTITIPASTTKGTNLQPETAIVITASNDTQEVCIQNPYTGNQATTTKTINGIPFYVTAATEGDPTGLKIEHTIYATFHNNNCFHMEEQVAWRGILAGASTLKEFDRPAINKLLNTIANSFKFVN